MQTAIYSAWNGKKVLAIDLDPQSNLSQALLGPAGYVKLIAACKPTVVQLLEDYQPANLGTAGPQPITIKDVIIKNVWATNRHLHLLPSRLELPLLARSLETFRAENDDHKIQMAGVVFNHGDYQPGPEAKASLNEVRALAKQHGWPIFANEVPHSKAIPKSAREASAVAHTSYARSGIKNAIVKFCGELFTKVGV